MANTIPLREFQAQQSIEEIKTTLRRFQDGYSRRDVRAVDDFMKSIFVIDNSLIVVGTGDEWCEGLDEVRALFKSDWEDWGDVAIEIENANIMAEGTTAWFTTHGRVVKKIDPDTFQKTAINNIRQTIDGNMTAKGKLMEIMRLSSEVIHESDKGAIYIWLLRLSGVLVKREATWRIQQLHFSFATTRTPDIRMASGDVR